MSTAENEFARMVLYKQAFNGVIQDYVITFKQDGDSMDDCRDVSFDLFRQLMERFKGSLIKSRLIAEVHYNMNGATGDKEFRKREFPCQRAERVDDLETFYYEHMQTIISKYEETLLFMTNVKVLRIHSICIKISKYG